VATASLASSDGSAGTLVDANVWLGCIDEASPWNAWALDQRPSCSERAPLHADIVFISELLIPGPDVNALDAVLDVHDTLRSALRWRSASLAAAADGQYPRRGGTKLKPVPNFFIGARAAVSNLSVLTRDPSPYGSCFGRLTVVAP
jgi:hypothetical protein